MAVDPSIALQVRPFQLQNPLEQAGQAMSLSNMIQQQQMGRMKMDQMRLDQQSMEALKQIFSDPANLDPATGAPTQATIGKVMAANPMLGMKLGELSAQMQLRKSQGMEAERKAQVAQRQDAATQSLASMLTPQGYGQQPADAPTLPSAVFTNREDAIAAARAADARGEPVVTGVPNQSSLQALMLQAAPQQAIPAMIRAQQQSGRPTVVGPGAGFVPPGGNAPVFTMPFAERPQPAPTVRVVPDANNPGQFNYEDMRRPGTPLARAPAPPVPGAAAEARDARKAAEKAAVAQRSFDSVNKLIDGLILDVTKDPTSVGAAGFVNRIIEGVTEQVPGMQGTVTQNATSVNQRIKLLQSTIYRDLVGAGQISPADYKHINDIIKGPGVLDSAKATTDALNEIREYLRGKLSISAPTNPGGKPRAEDFFR